MKRKFQVIPGGKLQKTLPVEPEGGLFKAYSIGDLIKGDTTYHDVKIHWYCLERDRPVGPYRELIADYDLMEEKHRSLLEQDLDRLFLEEEVRELERHLEDRFGLEVIPEPVVLPVTGRSCFSEEGRSEVYNFLELSENEDYPLSFKVWGYYSVKHRLSSPTLEKSVFYLHAALERLGLDPREHAPHLLTVVKGLYEEMGLFVRKRED